MGINKTTICDSSDDLELRRKLNGAHGKHLQVTNQQVFFMPQCFYNYAGRKGFVFWKLDKFLVKSGS